MDGETKPKGYHQRLKKLTVTAHPFDQFGGKFWVEVVLNSRKWVPSFQELFWIVKYLAFCEEQKYPSDRGLKGWRMPAEFLADACKPGATWEALKEKYNLPER